MINPEQSASEENKVLSTSDKRGDTKISMAIERSMQYKAIGKTTRLAHADIYDQCRLTTSSAQRMEDLSVGPSLLSNQRTTTTTKVWSSRVIGPRLPSNKRRTMAMSMRSTGEIGEPNEDYPTPLQAIIAMKI